MKRRIPVFMAGVLFCLVTAALGEGLFEDRLVVAVEKGLRGPRGMPGDIVQLKDDSLLMSYTRDASIMAVKSADQGKTWGESFTLVPKPQPPAKGWYAHPGFLRLENGEILLSYIYSTHPTTPYFGHNYYRRSADEGKTWTEQFIMTP
ncbi:MAG: sialidase family protein [Planctomycetota bacterium]